MKKLMLALFICMGLSAEPYVAKDFSHLIGMKGFSDALLNQHFKLYQGYVTNTNLLNEKLGGMLGAKGPDYAGLKRMFGWEFDGMRLHEYYFENLGGKEALSAESPLYKEIEKQFGSYEAWKNDFEATGLMRGIGWSVLYRDLRTGKLNNVWINEHDLGHLVGGKPILVMDVWEHAYITEYALDRAAYIKAFMDNVKWKVAEDRFSSN